MRAINLSMRPVQLAPVNGPGMLAPATEDSDGAHERELEEVTNRERALETAGTIALAKSKPTTGSGGDSA